MIINSNESEFKTIAIPDEAMKSLFENSVVYKRVYESLIEEKKSEESHIEEKKSEDIVSRIFSMYEKNHSMYPILINDYYSNLNEYEDIKLESSDSSVIELNSFIEKICKCENLLYENRNYSSLCDLVDSFYDLCQNAIFKYQNDNLLDESFRKSGFIKELLCPYLKRKENEEERYFRYGFNDPFIAATLIRISKSVNECYIDGDVFEKPHLPVLESSLFSRLSERMFNRFLYISGETYRLFLNRHTSEFVVCPRSDLSSIDDIKPIRLFEKIKSFIKKRINGCDDESIIIKVCMIGHTEPLAIEIEEVREAELSDLITSLMKWFTNQNSTKKLNLEILNLVNQNDYTAVCRRKKDLESDVLVEKEIIDGENIGYFIVKQYDYSVKFNFSTVYLCDLIRNHDITFILDCPWLTREDFELNKTVSMKYFCRELENCNIKEALGTRIDKNQSSMMRDLNVQFNRIMGSDTFDAGKIIRILKDSIPKKIEETLSESNTGDKVVYLFLSESTGVNFSYLNFFPLQRVELYEGKRFDIFQFCNYKVPIIKLENSEKKVNFTVRLWSIIKYISIGYAYEYFRDIIDEIKQYHSNKNENQIDYFDIYRNVFIQLSTSSIKNIKVDILFSDCLHKYFDTEELSALYENVFSLIFPLFKDVLFCNKHDNEMICSSQIRLAFSMNLYSSAKNEYEMYFWHKYRMAIKSNDFRTFEEISINNKLSFLNNRSRDEGFIEDDDFFKDKWIYDIMLKHLEENDEVTINQSYIINSAAPVYYGEYYSDKQFVKKIMDICKSMDNNSVMYINCKNALDLL